LPAPQAEGPPAVRVRELLEPAAARLELRLVVGGEGLDRAIQLSRVQRPGLALTGYVDYVSYGRVQIVGGSEIGYLKTLPARERAAALRRVAALRVSCFIVTTGHQAPRELLVAAERRGVPVLATPIESTDFVKRLSAFLEARLAPRLHLHSVLMDVFGLGVLITGESGIGKSECALELVDRGHGLVADDVVEIRRLGETLVGAAPELTRDLVELRGLGLVNVRELYGVSSTRSEQRLELVVNMARWQPDLDYERLGLSEERYTILGLELPLVRMPVAAGRNTALLIEVAARNQLLKRRGYDAARRFAERVDEMIEAEGRRPSRRRRRRRGEGG